MSGPILSFSTKQKPAVFVAINGTPYRLRRRSDFRVQQLIALSQQQQAVEALKGKTTLTDTEADELSAIIRTICVAALDAPESVIDKLCESDRLLLINQFAIESGALPPVPRRKQAPHR